MTKERRRHPFPIRRWSLRNFKSVEQADLDLAPLTILVGPNSSGKSSLLQSMLLVAQAAQEGPDALLPLNGPLAELGDFQDVLFAGRSDDSGRSEKARRAQQKQFHIGAEFDLGESSLSRFYTPPPVKGVGRGTKVLWQAAFGPGPKHEELGAAHLVSTSLTLGLTGEENSAWSFKTTGFRKKNLEAVIPGRYFASHGAILKLRGQITQGLTNWRQRRSVDSPGQESSRPKLTSTAGLVQAGGIPLQHFYEVDLVRLIAEDVLDLLKHQVYADSESSSIQERAGGERAGKAGALQQLVHAVASEVDMRLEEMENEAYLESPSRAKKRLKNFKELAPLLAHKGISEKVLRKVVASVEGRGSVLCPVETRRGIPFGFERIGLSLLAFLSGELLYLGPLREDPRVVYPPTPGRRGNVGNKGEKAIALLHACGDHEVICPHADRSSGQCKLSEAVGYWLRELGIAQEIDIELRTRLGLEPHLKLADVEKPLDMTGVGVGVSQIFPVLVMGLHSDPGSVLLMEQPELHLHPALQQKLGDFLLACARSGRQLIVETHSDHLISRLRRRIAEDESDEVREDVAFVFAERRGGRTRYRRVEVNRFGGIEEWPEGFFDQAAREAQQILRAGLAKKRRG